MLIQSAYKEWVSIIACSEGRAKIKKKIEIITVLLKSIWKVFGGKDNE